MNVARSSVPHRGECTYQELNQDKPNKRFLTRVQNETKRRIHHAEGFCLYRPGELH